MNSQSHNPDTCFVDDHIEPISEFDWSLVEDDARPEIEAEIRRMCAESVAKFAKRLLILGGRNKEQFFIAANCFAFAAGIHPSMDKSGEEIAETIGFGKQAFFKRVNACRDVLNLPHIKGTSRREETRKVFRETAKKDHENRREKRNQSNDAFLARLREANSGT